MTGSGAVSVARSPRRRPLIIGAAVCAVALLTGLWALRAGMRPPRQVDLPGGDAAAIGLAHGRALALPIRLLERRYLQAILRQAGDATARDWRARAAALFDRIDARWSGEVDALADAVGVSRDMMRFGNCFLDLGAIGAACRQVLVATTDEAGRPGVLHAHNLDWYSLGGAGSSIITVFRTAAAPDRLATVRVGMPGLVGALDIVNERGLAFSFNQLGEGGGDDVHMPVFIALRDMAETCAHFGEAEARLRDMPPGMPFIVGLSDAKTGQVAVFERGRDGRVAQREAVDGLLTADNTAQAGEAAEANRVDRAARARLRPPRDAGVAPAAVGPADVADVLRHPEVMVDANLYSVVFDWRRNQMHLACGRTPAAAGEYRAFPLFPGTPPVPPASGAP